MENKYWQSLSQYNNDPEFLEHAHKEFMSSPLKEAEESDGGIGRRDFMKLMAASTALATAGCFQRPMKKILPYVNQPEEITFGQANYYASTCQECGAGCGTLVKTREGRPIKVEGNPDHPMNKGALCARGQASILNLYDPDRLRFPVAFKRGSLVIAQSPWSELDAQIGEKLKAIKSKGGKVRLLSSTVNSPSTNRLIKDFLGAFAGGQHVVYEPLTTETIVDGQEASYGARVLPRYRFDLAQMIVSFDADFLGTWISPVEFTKGFTKNRKVSDKNKKMSKLVVFESAFTVTGSNSDERGFTRPEDLASVAYAVTHELAKLGVGSMDETLKGFSAEAVSQKTGVSRELIKATAKELSEHKGKSLVVAGSPQSLSQNALSLQVAVNHLNSVLQNDGVTVDHSVSPSSQSQGSYSDIAKLVKEMGDGHVDALFIYRANPGYNLPDSLGFKEAAKKVGLIVNFSDRADETADIADFICPDNHALESWSDAQPQKDLYSLVQPTIRPVYDTRSFQDSLFAFNKAGGLGVASMKTDWHDYIQNYWKENIYSTYGVTVPFATFWEGTLRDGVFDGLAKKGNRERTGSARSLKSAALREFAPKAVKKAEGEFSLALFSQVAEYDGRSANNPWLQELPDPVTRVVWDNYASLSPKTAATMHLTDGEIVKLTVGDKSLELPAHVQPGLHDKVVAVALGYGRTRTGQVGEKIGQNLFALAHFDKTLNYSGLAVSVKKTGARHFLASIQDQHTMAGRTPVKEATFKEYKENSTAGNEEHEELTTLWSGHKYKGYRWAMSIDLNSCTGCGACVIACQSENNVPTVGREAVARGRNMHWIRIDRYYSGTPDNPKVVMQPMLCQHCENAPCETVCPVLATVHDDEGLNSQIYNRCVGTRYCANNCPYKVRRFNWFDFNYNGQVRYPATLGQNPEVTVRGRGVMEKCTFCIQRIAEAKVEAKNANRTVRDGEIKTACQQSCPGEAIVFGNINDKESTVAHLSADARGYHALEELNVRPSVTYLTKIRNVERES